MQRRYLVIGAVVVIAAAVLVPWLVPGGETLIEPAEPPGTQIVVQWFDNSPPTSSVNADPVLDLLDMRSQNLYVVDSFDVGAGTMNVFLYSDDPDRAVGRVVELFEEGLLPPGMRIGIADTRGGEQSTRRYHPAYPPALAKFELMYPGESPIQIH